VSEELERIIGKLKRLDPDWQCTHTAPKAEGKPGFFRAHEIIECSKATEDGLVQGKIDNFGEIFRFELTLHPPGGSRIVVFNDLLSPTIAEYWSGGFLSLGSTRKTQKTYSKDYVCLKTYYDEVLAQIKKKQELDRQRYELEKAERAERERKIRTEFLDR
jgi:hypothetical protein